MIVLIKIIPQFMLSLCVYFWSLQNENIYNKKNLLQTFHTYRLYNLNKITVGRQFYVNRVYETKIYFYFM